jgi:4-carboxymuconolactone decarboxylase
MKGIVMAEQPINPELFAQGLQTRREVLGDAYVSAAIKNADEFTLPLQQFVTQYAWGDIWNRPGLDRKTRSMLVLAMIAVLNRPHELKLHVRGALNNGVTREEMREIFLQVAVYAGAPAAMDGFRNAKEALAAIEAEQAGKV